MTGSQGHRVAGSHGFWDFFARLLGLHLFLYGDEFFLHPPNHCWCIERWGNVPQRLSPRALYNFDHHCPLNEYASREAGFAVDADEDGRGETAAESPRSLL